MKADGQATADRPHLFRQWFAGAFGVFLAVSLLKFGNPPIMEKWVTPPGDIYEFLLGYPWPMLWAYGVFVIVLLLGFSTANWRFPRPYWLIALPLAWLVWQWLAGAHSIDPVLTRLTVLHFAICAGCFYLGLLVLAHARLAPLWCALGIGFVIMLALGFEQHFGGLEETRRYFFLYVYPKGTQLPPEYLKKLTSTRIFASLFYPNALAGALLLLLPPLTAVVLQTRRLTTGARTFLAILIAAASLACLFWSGSKGGWLLMLLQGVTVLLYLRIGRRMKLAILLVLTLGGLAGFGLKYAGFFKRGATSVVARFDYWRAAAQTAAANPLWGTGPGTFAIPYERIKRPESEMSRLVHNDYLEQATDSGFVGFVLYLVFIGGALWLTRPGGMEDLPYFGVWLGCLGWALQSLVEFGLYVPALAWPAFGFLGLLLGRRDKPTALKSVDKTKAAALTSARK